MDNRSEFALNDGDDRLKEFTEDFTLIEEVTTEEILCGRRIHQQFVDVPENHLKSDYLT